MRTGRYCRPGANHIWAVSSRVDLASRRGLTCIVLTSPNGMRNVSCPITSYCQTSTRRGNASGTSMPRPACRVCGCVMNSQVNCTNRLASSCTPGSVGCLAALRQHHPLGIERHRPVAAAKGHALLGLESARHQAVVAQLAFAAGAARQQRRETRANDAPPCAPGSANPRGSTPPWPTLAPRRGSCPSSRRSGGSREANRKTPRPHWLPTPVSRPPPRLQHRRGARLGLLLGGLRRRCNHRWQLVDDRRRGRQRCQGLDLGDGCHPFAVHWRALKPPAPWPPRGGAAAPAAARRRGLGGGATARSRT